jgi:hypothetical protein
MLSRGKFLNLESLKRHFLDFGERFYTILMVRKRHCNIYQRPPWSMFLLYSLSLGAPIWPIGVGAPRVRPVWTHSSYATDAGAKLFEKVTFVVTIWARFLNGARWKRSVWRLRANTNAVTFLYRLQTKHLSLILFWIYRAFIVDKTRALKYRSENRLTIWKSHLNLGNEFPNPTVKTSHLITHFQFTFYTFILWFSI